MNLREEILREHSKAQTVRLTQYIGHDPVRFAELMQLFFDGPYQLTQRAAWVVSGCAEAYPALIMPYLGKLIQFCQNPVYEAVKRNTLRLLQFVSVPDEWQGSLIDLCFTVLGNAHEAVSIKVFAMTVACNSCCQYPELKNELKILIEEQMPYQSAAFRSRARKILRTLNQL